MFKEDYIELFRLAETHNADPGIVYNIYQNAITNLSEHFQYAAPQEIGFAKVNLYLESLENKPLNKKPLPKKDNGAKVIKKTAVSPAGAHVALGLVAAHNPDNPHLIAAVKHLQGSHPDIANALHTGMKAGSLKAKAVVVSKPQKHAVNLKAEREKRIKAETDKLHKADFDSAVDKHSKAVAAGDFENSLSGGRSGSPAVRREYSNHKNELYSEIAKINAIKGVKDKKAATDQFLKDNDHVVHLLANDHKVASLKDTDLRVIDKRSKSKAALTNKKDTIKPGKDAGIKSVANSFVHKEAVKIHNDRADKAQNQRKNRIELTASAEKNAAEKHRQSEHEHAQRETKQLLTKRAQEIQKRKGFMGKVKKMIGFKDKPRTV